MGIGHTNPNCRLSASSLLFCYPTLAAASNNTALRHHRKDPMQTASIQWIGEQNSSPSAPPGTPCHSIPTRIEQGSRGHGDDADGAGRLHCHGMVLILEKKRQKLESLEVLCSANAPPSHPPSGRNSKSSSACAERSTKPP